MPVVGPSADGWPQTTRAGVLTCIILARHRGGSLDWLAARVEDSIFVFVVLDELGDASGIERSSEVGLPCG